MAFELWDIESRNIVGDYATEAEALAVVRDLVHRDGPRPVESLLLAFEDDIGRTTPVASGTELVERAVAMTGAVVTRIAD